MERQKMEWRGGTILKTLIGSVLAAALLALALPVLVAPQETAPAAGPERVLSFFNIHNGAHLSVVYRRGDEYLPEGLAEINHILRDPVCGDEHPIDPGVLDFLYDLLEKLDYRGEVQAVCGFRSVETNTMLHNTTSGVVLNSMHTKGRALDFRLTGLDMKKVWEVARSMKRGGTGYYKGSDFVHIDTGPVRFW
jgi:uncharacterized protein YcbK (DUF882 family)